MIKLIEYVNTNWVKYFNRIFSFTIEFVQRKSLMDSIY